MPGNATETANTGAWWGWGARPPTGRALRGIRLGTAPVRFRGRLFRLARRMALWGEDWLVPPACATCGRRRYASFPLCRTCLRVLRDARPEEDEAVTGLPWVRALFRLTPPLHGLIHGFKYRGQRRHIAWLASWLRWRRAWSDDFVPTYDAFVPVPLHPARRRARGYNQAEALARAMSAVSGPARDAEHARGVLPVETRAMARVRATETQTRLGKGLRAANLDGAFRVDPARVAGRRLLLVDDVCTTGSTLSHCREALLAAGAARVDALVLAVVVREKGAPPLPDFSRLDGLETAAGFFA